MSVLCAPRTPITKTLYRCNCFSRSSGGVVIVGISAAGWGGLYGVYCCGPSSAFSLMTGITLVSSNSDAPSGYWLKVVCICAGEYWGGTLPQVLRSGCPFPPPIPTASGPYGVPCHGWKSFPDGSSAWPLTAETGRPAPTGLPSISAVPDAEWRNTSFLPGLPVALPIKPPLSPSPSATSL